MSRKPASLAPREREVCVKPFEGIYGTDAESMDVSVALKGPGGAG